MDVQRVLYYLPYYPLYYACFLRYEITRHKTPGPSILSRGQGLILHSTSYALGRLAVRLLRLLTSPHSVKSALIGTPEVIPKLVCHAEHIRYTEYNRRATSER